MGIAVHTGIGYGAIRPSGRSVQQNGLGDFAFVHPGQYGVVENLDLLFTDSVTVGGLPALYTDTISFSDWATGSLTPGHNTDEITETVFGAAAIDNVTEHVNLTDDNGGEILEDYDNARETLFGAAAIDKTIDDFPVNDKGDIAP